MNQSDFDARLRRICAREAGILVPSAMISTDVPLDGGKRHRERTFMPRIAGFFGALGAASIAADPDGMRAWLDAVPFQNQLGSTLNYGMALTLGVILAVLTGHLLRLIVLRSHAAKSAAVLAGVVLGVVASEAPPSYVDGASAFMIDGASRAIGVDLTTVTPDTFMERLDAVLNRS